MIFSRAFLTLSGKAPQVYMLFLSKRQLKRLSKDKDPIIVNNGEIVFTYDEAEDYGIDRQAFLRALDQLIEHGFIDIAKTGAGLYKSSTFYSISERWREFGTADFERRERKKRKQPFGFQKGHPDYRRHK